MCTFFTCCSSEYLENDEDWLDKLFQQAPSDIQDFWQDVVMSTTSPNTSKTCVPFSIFFVKLYEYLHYNELQLLQLLNPYIHIQAKKKELGKKSAMLLKLFLQSLRSDKLILPSIQSSQQTLQKLSSSFTGLPSLTITPRKTSSSIHGSHHQQHTTEKKESVDMLFEKEKQMNKDAQVLFSRAIDTPINILDQQLKQFESIHFIEFYSFVKLHSISGSASPSTAQNANEPQILKAISNLVQQEDFELAANKQLLNSVCVLIARDTLEWCYMSKLRLWNQLKVLLFNNPGSNDKTISHAERYRRNYEILTRQSLYELKSNSLIADLQKHQLKREEQGDDAQEPLLVKYANLYYPFFTFEYQLQQSMLSGVKDKVIEEFPCYCKIGLIGLPCLLFMTEKRVVLVPTYAVKANETGPQFYNIPYVQIYSLNHNSVKGTLYIQKRDGLEFNLSFIANINELYSNLQYYYSTEWEKVRNTAETEIPIKYGLLTKRGGSVGTWKKRMFILYNDRIVYRKATADESSQNVNSSSIANVTLATTAEVAKEAKDGQKSKDKEILGQVMVKSILGIEKENSTKTKYPNSFSLLTVERRYRVQAPDEHELRDWYIAIQTVLKRQNSSFPYIYFGVFRKNVRGKFQWRHLQFDFLEKKLKNLKGSDVKHAYNFETLAGFSKDKYHPLHFYLDFKKKVYEAFLQTPRQRAKILVSMMLTLCLQHSIPRVPLYLRFLI